MIVGAIEEILMDGEFVGVQTEFCQRHCGNMKIVLSISV
jgi:hypothetical protein